MTLGSLIGGALRNTMPALFPDGLLHRSMQTRAPNGDVTPGFADPVGIKVQRDVVTEAMRRGEGYTDTSVRLIVMGAATLTTDDEITDADGQRWSLTTCPYDAASSHWDCMADRT